MWSLHKPAGLILGLVFVATFLADVRCNGNCLEQIGWLPRNSEFRSHCESEGAEPKWTCFASQAYNIQSTWVTTPSKSIKNVETELLLIKDGDMHLFTTRDPSTEFKMEFRDQGFTVTYSQYEKTTGCYKLAVQKAFPSYTEMVLSNKNFKTIAATIGDVPREGRTCTKWTNIEFYHRDGSGKWATLTRIT